jgi:3-deoxy-D-manno-octulosonate 8-phosphate phosphatase (KDO 8-P phosphatase)
MQIKALILDWDGVWTNGRKRPDGQSDFSEHDTMGLNLLRFAHYAATGELLRVAIVTGERNPTAEFLVQREHYDDFIFYARDKTKAIPLLEARWGVPADQWGFVFDDVLDLGLAALVGRRAMVQWDFTKAIQDVAQAEGLVDEWIQPEGAVRRWCESYLIEMDWLHTAVAERRAWSPRYQAYWALRNEVQPTITDLSPR